MNSGKSINGAEGNVTGNVRLNRDGTHEYFMSYGFAGVIKLYPVYVRDKIIRNDSNCQTCKLYGKCMYHKWLIDTTKCEHKM